MRVMLLGLAGILAVSGSARSSLSSVSKANASVGTGESLSSLAETAAPTSTNQSIRTTGRAMLADTVFMAGCRDVVGDGTVIETVHRRRAPLCHYGDATYRLAMEPDGHSLAVRECTTVSSLKRHIRLGEKVSLLAGCEAAALSATETPVSVLRVRVPKTAARTATNVKQLGAAIALLAWLLGFVMGLLIWERAPARRNWDATVAIVIDPKAHDAHGKPAEGAATTAG